LWVLPATFGLEKHLQGEYLGKLTALEGEARQRPNVPNGTKRKGCKRNATLGQIRPVSNAAERRVGKGGENRFGILFRPAERL
jgi:hypothetical protein